MTIKDIYAITDKSNSNEFAHFFMSVLIPLLYYDIQTKHAHTFNIKINVFKFEHILKEIFKKRIIFNYINNHPDVQTQVDKNYYWDLYIDLLKNKEVNAKNNIILLPSFDGLFTISDHKYINKDIIINQNTLNKYEKQYIDYYSGNNDSKINNKLFDKIKEKYKMYSFTDKYFKLIKYKKSIDRFLHNKYPSQKHHYKIILIERPYKPIITKDTSKIFVLNTSGQRRLIYNHDNLKNTLSKLYGDDFINVSLDNLKFEQQYNLFKNAKIIIAQHGASLCNLFFSKPNFKTHFIEIAPKMIENYIDYIKNFCELCEINYYNVKQPQMTKDEWGEFSSKHNIDVPNLKMSDDEWENISNLDFFNFNEKNYAIKSFIKHSGSVNVDKIVNIITSIL